MESCSRGSQETFFLGGGGMAGGFLGVGWNVSLTSSESSASLLLVVACRARLTRLRLKCRAAKAIVAAVAMADSRYVMRSVAVTTPLTTLSMPLFSRGWMGDSKSDVIVADSQRIVAPAVLPDLGGS